MCRSLNIIRQKYFIAIHTKRLHKETIYAKVTTYYILHTMLLHTLAKRDKNAIYLNAMEHKCYISKTPFSKNTAYGNNS